MANLPDCAGKDVALVAPMRGNKTDYLIYLIEECEKIARENGFFVVAFKPFTDHRPQNKEDELGYDPRHIFSSLSGNFVNGVFPFKSTEELFRTYYMWKELSERHFSTSKLVVIVDEVQFADPDYPEFVQRVKKDKCAPLIHAFLNYSFSFFIV